MALASWLSGRTNLIGPTTNSAALDPLRETDAMTTTPNTPCLNPMIAKQQRQVQGGNALDKPTFGEKFKMSTGLDKNKSVNSVKGTKPQRGNTERELMDLLSEGRRN